VQHPTLRQPVGVLTDPGDRLKLRSAGLALLEVGSDLRSGVVGHIQQVAGLLADDELAGRRPPVDASWPTDGLPELGRDLWAG
jgi:hypothetical protein